MRLTRVSLTNFKRFGDPGLEVELRPGVNVLTGPNGAGKTTVLEAVGLALFHHTPPGATLDGLRRLGAGPWRVVVRFEGEDRLNYRVERDEDRCLLVAEDREERLASGVRAVAAALPDILGLDPELPPEESFRRILSAPQGRSTRDLELPEAERRRLFDPLFKVDRFEALDAGLAPITRSGAVLQRVLQPLEEEARRQREQAAGLSDAETRREELARELHEHTRAREETADRLRQIRGALETRLDREGELRRLHQDLAMRQQALDAEEARVTEAAGRLEEATQARLQRDAFEPGARRYERARSELKELEPGKGTWSRLKGELEEAESARARLLASIREEEKRQERLRENLEENQDQLASMEARLSDLGDEIVHLDEDQQRRGKRLGQARQHLRRSREALLAAVQIRRDLQVLEEEQEDRRRRLATLEERQRLAAANPEEQGRLPQLVDGLRRLRHRHSMILGKIELLEKDRILLVSRQCPFVEQTCPTLPDVVLPDELDSKLRELNRRRLELDTEIQEYETWMVKAEKAEITRSEGEQAGRRAKELAAELQRTDDRIRDRLEEMTPARAAESLLAATELLAEADREPRSDLLRRIERLRGTTPHSVGRAGAPLDEARELQAELEEVVETALERQAQERLTRDDTREENTRLDEQVRHLRLRIQEAEVETRKGADTLSDLTSRLEVLDRDLEQLQTQAAPFRNLDDEEARLQEVRADTERDYHEWLRLESVAGEQESRRQAQAAVERERSRMAEEVEQLERRVQEATRASGGADELAEMEAQRDRLTAEEGRLASRVQADLDRVEALDAEVEERRRARDRARELRREIDATQKAGSLLASLRRVFQNAAPRLAGRYLREVSREATRGYRALVPTAPAEVRWEQGYRLSLRGRFGSDGEVTNKDLALLSGGERAAVSVCLRLALARVFSRAGLLLLDEPTAHLDQARRASLAVHLDRAARELGFNQLVVVTHDPGFDAVPHHAVHLASGT